MSDRRAKGGKSRASKLKPKKHHGYNVVLFVLGTLLPPLAVAARFGIGKDFWINLVLTICGYFPGHGHNFYIQNIRNNDNHARTPKWAARYGLVDTSAMDRKKKRSEWATRYGDRLPNSVLDNQEVEEGQLPDRAAERQDSAQSRGPEFWREDEENYYGSNGRRDTNTHGRGESSSTLTSDNSGRGRWHYPANFDDAVVESTSTRRKSKSSKKDRWARTEEAYARSGDSDAKRNKKNKRKKGDRSEVESLPQPPSDYYERRPDSFEGGPRESTVNGQQDSGFDHQF